MKTTLSILALAGISVFGVGCAYRDAAMWQADTNKVLETKNNDIRGCYDNFLKSSPGAGGKVTVHFEVETEGGKIQNVAVDKAGTTAPEPVAECVKSAINGLVIAPPDRRVGQATYVYEFSQPPAPPAPPAPKS